MSDMGAGAGAGARLKDFFCAPPPFLIGGPPRVLLLVDLSVRRLDSPFHLLLSSDPPCVPPFWQRCIEIIARERGGERQVTAEEGRTGLEKR